MSLSGRVHTETCSHASRPYRAFAVSDEDAAEFIVARGLEPCGTCLNKVLCRWPREWRPL